MTSLTERALPGDHEAEKAVVGCLLADPQRLPEVAEIVSADDFIDDVHATIFDILVRMHQGGRPIDPPLVVAALTAAARGDEAAARRLREALLDAAQTSGAACYAGHHAAVVAGHAVRRGVIALCAEIAERVGQHEALAEVLADAIARLTAMAERVDRLRLPAPLTIASDRLARVASAAQAEADALHSACLPAPPAAKSDRTSATAPRAAITVTRRNRRAGR